MDIYLIRHTSIAAEPGACYGQSNVDLSGRFPEEKNHIQKRLPLSGEDAVYYSSPLKRCRILASALASGTVHLDERLQELDFGEWEGQKWDQISPESLREWMNDFVNTACPGGECYRELIERATEWWEEVIEKNDKTVVVVTHAGVIRCLLSYVLDIPYSNSFRLAIEPGSVSAVAVNDRSYTVEFINRR